MGKDRYPTSKQLMRTRVQVRRWIMTEATWRYLKEACGGVYPESDLGEVVARLWPDREGAARDLAAAWTEVKAAEEDEADRQALLSASAGYNVGGLPCCLPVMRQVLAAGLLTVGRPAVEFLQRRFAESSDSVERAGVALLLGEFGAAAAGIAPLLAAVLAEPDPDGGRRSLRVAAAYTLGEIGAATDEDEAEVALAGAVEVLIRVAGDSVESQPLRSYCIEALLDIGPPARSAIPVLERILRDDTADDDLRHFAWSALKSVGAPFRDHPCGGTVAEHMRSLYRTE